MKLQNLIIIFIIIIIPIVLFFSYYLGLEADTIRMQTDYDEKLIEATKEAVEAFEINTVEWNNEYSSLANNKRRSLASSINVFTTSLANKLGIGGTAKENILNYVPAIVFIMYDGYYIYSPTYVPQTLTDENGLQLYYYNHSEFDEYITTKATQIKTNTSETIAGEPMYVAKNNAKTGNYNGQTITFTTNINDAKTTYKHVLKTFVPYTSQEKYNREDYVINYTLDNYVRVYGEYESREGYIIDTTKLNITPNSTSITFDGCNIFPESLAENIAVRDSKEEEIQVKNYIYIYNSNNEKRYYDRNSGEFFSIDNYYVKNYDLPDEYKKVSILQNETEYLELYQKLNGEDTTWYYKNGENEYIVYSYQPSINKKYDCSAINYYVENYCFNKWLEKNNITIDLTKRNDKIIENINTNLNLAISNYSANSKINYTIPELSPTDWEQALSNISMITFFQGVKIGLKTYNNYAIVTSTENNEYVSEDSLYYSQDYNEYYHRYNCSQVDDVNGHLDIAYKNIDYKVQNCSYDIYENKDNTLVIKETDLKYYYKHTYVVENNTCNNLECFDCIVNRNNMQETTKFLDEYKSLKYNALARERYIQMSKNKIIDYIPIYDSSGDTEEACSHENHNYISIGDGQHKIVCSVCNAELRIEECTPGDWHSNVRRHWRNCEKCQNKMNFTSHTYTYTSNGDSGHSIYCSECGRNLGSFSHSLVYYDSYQSRIGKIFYYYHKVKCDLCDYTGTDEKCTPGEDWQCNSSQHWKICQRCNAKINVSNHRFKNNICITCGYVNTNIY